jgi:hypothetical protein
MSDPKRHTRVTAELAAYSRPTHKILRQSLVELLGETVPDEGVIDVDAIEAPLSSSNMHVRPGASGTVTDHERPTLRMRPLARIIDE